MRPLVAVPGRLSPKAERVRGEAVASVRLGHESIARAGAVSVMIPPLSAFADDDAIDAVLSRVHGVALFGGGDLDPARYGASSDSAHNYGIVPEHDEIELAIARRAVALDLPLLAICRGVQVLNVALGGTLHQHLADVLPDGESHWDVTHPVHLESGCRLAVAMGTTSPAGGHSYHHQGLDTIGSGLRVVGRADDGVVEAVEHESATWVVGVQWHPEDTAHDDAEQQRVLDGFVAAAQRRV